MNWWNPFRRLEKRHANNFQNVSVQLGGSEYDLQTALALVFGQYTRSNSELGLSAVFRAVNLIAGSVSSLPVILYKRDSKGNKTEAVNESLYTVLRKRPNIVQTPYDLFFCMIADMLLRGNGYAIIHRNPDDLSVKELEYVPAADVTIVKRNRADGSLESVAYNIARRVRLYESEEILHFRNYPDHDGVTGMSTLSYAYRTMKLGEAGENAALGYFESGGKLSGVLTTQGMLTEKQKTEMKQAWAEAFGSGAGTPGGIAVLSGNQQYQAIQVNPTDAQLLESRRFQVSEIARFFGVSPILLYDLEKNSYAAASEAHLQLLTDTLQPIIFKIERELEFKLLVRDQDRNLDIHFDTTEFLRTNNKENAEYYRTLNAMGVLSVNEIRSFLDLNAIEDGDEHYVAANLATLSNVKNIASSTQTAQNRHDGYADNETDK
jgi:HK97 family phage portal protein